MQAIEISCRFNESDTLYLSDFSSLVEIPTIYATITEGIGEAQVELHQEDAKRLHEWIGEWLREQK